MAMVLLASPVLASALPGEMQASPQRAAGPFPIVRRAASSRALLDALRKPGWPVHDATVRCGARRFLWATIDEGSGVYRLHGLLYEVTRSGVRMVLHVQSGPDVFSLDAKGGRDRVTIYERAERAPGKPSPLIEYYCDE